MALLRLMLVLRIAGVASFYPAMIRPLGESSRIGRHSVSSMSSLNRRDILSLGAAFAGTVPFLRSLPSFAKPDSKPVLVLGASGGTGLECVKYLVSQGRPCIAATRNGQFDTSVVGSSFVSVAKGDVTSGESLASLIQPGKLSAVIYAASASRQSEAKKSSNAKAVDCDGVIECAKLCIASEVPRMVLVSSGGVSKPKSLVYLFLNTAANGIMKAKIDGEDGMRRLYAAAGVSDRGLGYTIVRPGGLLRDASRGVANVELNQGDEKSGRISRADVAAICIESLQSAAAFDTTFECYDADTGKGLNDVGASNAMAVGAGVKTQATTMSSGSERRGETWPQLFEGLRRDPLV